MKIYDYINKKNNNNLQDKYKKRNKSDARAADKYIYYCKSCNRCWQYSYQAQKDDKSKADKKMYIRFYFDFPTYGKKRKTCQWCKE